MLFRSHVSAFEIVGQLNIHAEICDRMLLKTTAILNANRMAQVFDANFVDRDVAGVGTALNVSNFRHSNVSGFGIWHVRKDRDR